MSSLDITDLEAQGFDTVIIAAPDSSGPITTTSPTAATAPARTARIMMGEPRLNGNILHLLVARPVKSFAVSIDADSDL